jgi:hypothetical protein
LRHAPAIGISWPQAFFYKRPEKAMMRLVAAIFVGCCLGCVIEANRGQWDEVWKDARGDNMRMMSDQPDKSNR